MRRDPRSFLWDARAAADAIVAFARGRSFDDYAGDLMFRSAVERQFEISNPPLESVRSGA